MVDSHFGLSPKSMRVIKASEPAQMLQMGTNCLSILINYRMTVCFLNIVNKHVDWILRNFFVF